MTSSTPPTLLLIEDNPDTRTIYKEVFERDGFKVLVAEDGEKGLSYAKATLPNVIVLDLMLPKMGGLHILKELRASQETQHIPVMIFSAQDAQSDLKQMPNIGLTEYSIKTMNSPKQMLARVRTLLERAAPKTSGITVCPRCGHTF